jgi:hypothetical protein
MQKITNYLLSTITSHNLWIGLLVISINVQAAISDEQIAAFVEALRLAAPKSGNLYSDWQIKAANISNWSQRCLGRSLTTSEFEADLEIARAILECKMGYVLREQYELSEYNEAVAVQRTAAWWMTGVAEQYQSGNIANYTQKVLTLYYQELKNISPAATESLTTTVPPTLPNSQNRETTPPPVSVDTQSPNPSALPDTESPTLPVFPDAQSPTLPLLPPISNTPPVSPGVTEKQITDLVEAIRLATPKNRNLDDNLYSEWQIKPSAIRSWSRECLQQELTPDDFAADPQMSRTILTCKIGQILKQEYTASHKDIFIAVRRTAAWWISGDPQQYKTGVIGDYTLKVLEFYLQL